MSKQIDVALKGRLWDDLGNQPRYQLGYQLWDQLRYQLWDELWRQLGDQLRDQLLEDNDE